MGRLNPDGSHSRQVEFARIAQRSNGLTGDDTNLRDNQHLRIRGVVFGPGGAEDRWILEIPNGGFRAIESAVWSVFGSSIPGFRCCENSEFMNGLAGEVDVVVYEVVTNVRQEYRTIAPALDAEQFEQLLGFKMPTMPDDC